MRSRLCAFPTLLVVLVTTLATGAAHAGGTMKMTAATIEKPADDAVQELAGLFYGTRVVSAVRTVRLTGVEDKGAKQVLTWLFTGDNQNAKIQRVDLTVELLDGEGERRALGRSTYLLQPSAKGQEHELDMKVAPEDWAAAVTVRIQANFVAR